MISLLIPPIHFRTNRLFKLAFLYSHHRRSMLPRKSWLCPLRVHQDLERDEWWTVTTISLFSTQRLPKPNWWAPRTGHYLGRYLALAGSLCHFGFEPPARKWSSLGLSSYLHVLVVGSQEIENGCTPAHEKHDIGIVFNSYLIIPMLQTANINR